MAVLTNNINAQNIVDRFADYVVASANVGIVWHSGAFPFDVYSGYFPNIFGGNASGKAIGINGTNLGGVGALITASTIINVLRAETATFTRIRQMRAILFITGTGFITPRPNGQASTPTDLRTDLGPITGQGPGTIRDSTNISNLNTTYLQGLAATTSTGIANDGVSLINVANLEAFFTNLRTAYNTARATVHTQQVNVCHASCHNNCHSSRGRR
jgi:hypothetical protein